MEISSSKGLDTFTEEILNGKLDFLCSDILSNLLAIWILSRWGTLKSRSRIVQGGTEWNKNSGDKVEMLISW